MKIGFFVRSISNGGAEKVAAQLICIWKQLGHETVLMTELPEPDANICKHAVCEFVGSSAVIVPERLGILHQKHRFDIVIFNDAINSEWFWATLTAAMGLGLRTVVINHHTANNWMYGGGNTKELFMNDVLSKVDIMVCVDRIWALWWKYRGVNAVFIQNPSKLRMVESVGSGNLQLVNDVDEAVAALNGKSNIIWIGRIGDALKRPRLAIEIFAKYAYVNGAAKMSMLGNVNMKVKRQLLRKIPGFIKDRVTFPGFVDEVEKYLVNADAHLFTSVTEVTIPQVILEASAAGVDTIAFNQPVLKEAQPADEEESIDKKWGKVLVGENVECDYDKPEVLHALMDELHRSQQWFALHHLPELSAYRRFKVRINPLYLLQRFFEKTIARGK